MSFINNETDRLQNFTVFIPYAWLLVVTMQYLLSAWFVYYQLSFYAWSNFVMMETKELKTKLV